MSKTDDAGAAGSLVTLMSRTVLVAVAAALVASALIRYFLAIDGSATQLSFTAMGTLGAIFANATGAGGGVVFIPVFNQLGFNDTQAVATSLGIQCFGMTMGAVLWSQYWHRQRDSAIAWHIFWRAIALCAPLSAVGIWSVQWLKLQPPAGVNLSFALFSLVLGVAILFTTARTPRSLRRHLTPLDTGALALLSLVGGVVTAWLSVGVGEFVAFYLILRRYDVTQSIAIAVVITAISVWCAAPVQVIDGDAANWPVIVFAGPGAVVGAVLARVIVLWLGARRLKLFFGVWLLVIGLAEMLA